VRRRGRARLFNLSDVRYTFRMAELPSPLPLRDLFDAAVRHRSVQLTCRRCGHSVSFAGAALWWLFERKGWRDRFHEVERRFHCRPCRGRDGERIRPSVELVTDPPSETMLPMPSEIDWKRELRRRR
jgi:hypothetical protein